MGGHRARRALRALALVPLLVPLVGSPALAQEQSGLVVRATIDGRDVATADANDPLQLQPDRDAVLDLTVENRGEEPVFVRSVRLDGRVVGLTFFTFSTRVDLTVPPGEEGSRRYAVDLADLGEQATGLVPGRLLLLDQDREPLHVTAFPVDVRGSLTSVYGVFALGVALVTAALLLGLVLRLVTGLLPANRWSRAVRFAWPGAGAGLTLAFSASALRLAVPSSRTALTLVVVGALAGLVAGYLSPQRQELADDLDEDDVVRPTDGTTDGRGDRAPLDGGLRVIDLRDPADEHVTLPPRPATAAPTGVRDPS